MHKKDFILASHSPQRYSLLRQILFEPMEVDGADVDETPRKYEKPTEYVKRMAYEKARAVASKHPGNVILAGDTIVTVGSKILQKAPNAEAQKEVMRLLSGKAHKVLSGVCVIDSKGNASVKCVSTRIVMKKLTNKEIEDYVATNEWVGCAGYKIEGCLAGFVKKIIGSYSNVVGLPLCEVRNMLNGVGIR